MRSIRTQLSLRLVITLVLLFFIQLVLVSYTIEHLTEEFVLSHLKQDAETILGTVKVEQDKAILDESKLADVYHRPYSGYYYQLEFANQDLYSRSLWDKNFELQDVSVGEEVVQYQQGPMGQLVMIYIAGFEKHNLKFTLSVGLDVLDLKEDVFEMQLAYAGVSLIAIIVLMYLQFATLKHGFKPWERVREQLRAMEQGELRMLDEDVPIELTSQVKEINRLVDLLGQRVERSRNALGNLAHAIKTPLSVVLRTLEDVEENADKKVLIEQELKQIQQLIERELKRARLAAGDSADRFDIYKDVDGLVFMMKKVYETKHLNIEVVYNEIGTCSLDRQDVLEILGNIIDNACKWANTNVLVTITLSKELCVRVEDDGPGVDEATRSELMQRGVRIDESTAGHGLGLAIVQDVVSHYHGSLAITQSIKLGGFCAEVRLPLLRPSSDA